jgi:hypothetical protein
MGDLKPLGSEKLNGNDKLKRILELTYYNSTPKKSTSNNTKAETIKESVGNGVYGIVKERDGYYVKKGLNENSLDYIGGLFMKNKNRFSSYAEALKRMDLLVGQENLQEATKYVLKQKPTGNDDMGAVPPPPDASVPPVPEGDVPPPPAPEGEGGEMAPEGGEMAPEGGEEQKRSDYMADIQKYAGKLGQELRDQREKLESDDIKYVLNMVISAVDLNSLEDDDIEDIGKKFEREEGTEEGGEEVPFTPEDGGEEVPSVPEDGGETQPVPTPDEEELGETMDKLESFINSGIENQFDEVSLDQYNDLSGSDDIQELDLDEIKDEINKSIGETLSKYFK